MIVLKMMVLALAAWDLKAAERLNFDFESLYIQNGFRQTEGQGGRFDPIEAKITGRSVFTPTIEAYLELGSSDLLYRPHWSTTNPSSVSFNEAKAIYHSPYGDFYAGQARTPMGWEGTQDEKDLWLPRSFLYQKRLVPLYDTGAGFHSQFRNYYLNLMVHQGEGAGATNPDERVFVTGQWGATGPARSNMGLSVMTGRYKDPTTLTEKHLRAGTAFFGFNIVGLGLQVDATYMRVADSIQHTDQVVWHGDLQHPLVDRVNLIGRFEQYIADTRDNALTENRFYLGGEWKSKAEVSRFFAFYVRSQESPSIANDQILVLWRIMPPID